jgi:shikimate dehydrogenase
VNADGHLKAYNTDYTAIEQLLASNEVPTSYSVLVQGAGGMAKATVAALRDAGFTDVTVLARNETTGRALAGQYGFQWRPELDGGTADLIINVTPIGMAGSTAGGPDVDTLAFPQEAIDAARVVFDVVALPAETPLIKAARAAGKPVITGAEVATIQALEQFVLYTGVRPTPEQVRAAEEFMRAQ